MKELNIIERATDKVLPVIVLWVILAAIANGLMQLEFSNTILGEAVIAGLQLVGLFLFVKAVWKWYRRKKERSIKASD